MSPSVVFESNSARMEEWENRFTARLITGISCRGRGLHVFPLLAANGNVPKACRVTRKGVTVGLVGLPRGGRGVNMAALTEPTLNGARSWIFRVGGWTNIAIYWGWRGGYYLKSGWCFCKSRGYNFNDKEGRKCVCWPDPNACRYVIDPIPAMSK
jgi:hypothetical protein